MKYSHLWPVLGVIACVLAARVSGTEILNILSYGFMGLVFVFSLKNFGLRECYLVIFSLAVAVGVVMQVEDWAPAIVAGLQQAAFLMAFIFLVTLLHETALFSPSVQQFGTYLTGQAPGKSFGALFWGSNLLAVVFNLGIVSMLTPLILRGEQKNADSDSASHGKSEQNRRRQYSAILRGLSWTVAWSPTAIAPVALFELIPGIDRLRWTLIGFGLVVLVFLVAWLEDKLRFRSIDHQASSAEEIDLNPVAMPWSAALSFFAAMVSLCLIISVVVNLSEETIVFGLMVACPIMFVGWLLMHHTANTTRLEHFRHNSGLILGTRLPKVSTVAVSLACSGFIGRAGAAMVPAERLLGATGFGELPDFLLLFLIPVLIVVLSWFALSPIMVAVFLGSLFGSLPVLPTDPTLLALSISAGWALSMTSSPFATVVLLMSRMTGMNGLSLSLGWNWRYNVALLVLLFCVLTLLTRFS